MNIREGMSKAFFGSKNDSNNSRKKIPKHLLNNLQSIIDIKLDYVNILESFCNNLKRVECEKDYPYFNYDELKPLMSQLDEIYKLYQFDYRTECDLTDKRLKNTINVINKNFSLVYNYRLVHSGTKLNIDFRFPNLTLTIKDGNQNHEINIMNYDTGSSVRNNIVINYINAAINESKDKNNPNEFLSHHLSVKDNINEAATEVYKEIKNSYKVFEKNRPADYKHTDSEEYLDWDALFTGWCNIINKHYLILLKAIDKLYIYTEQYLAFIQYWQITKFPDESSEYQSQISDNALNAECWIKELNSIKYYLKPKNNFESNHVAHLYMLIFLYEKVFIPRPLFCEEVDWDPLDELEKTDNQENNQSSD